MKFHPLADTGIELPEICLGTMTFGEQNTQAEAFEQLNYALDQGIYFWDTAEMYPVPPKVETQGRTEAIIGEWIKANPTQRNALFLASKIAGPAYGGSHIREGKTRYVAPHLRQALDQSLQRLNTDYIDLYQLHWPERQTNFFGKLGYAHAKEQETDLTRFEETLEALGQEIQQGRIKHIGLSNETPWGIMKFLAIAERLNLQKFVSVQNPYNLLNRTYEVGSAEVSIRENIGLLAYSPLAFGMLTGKYLNGAQPEDGRITKFSRFTRYTNPEAIRATAAYAEVAKKHGLTLTELSLAFIKQQPFVTSTIIGATTLDQLKENINAFRIELSDDVLEDIEKVHQTQPNPAP
ncbi:NADP(H)-dependent aldo-keto reductase [Acinetobacter apis]|uniref:Protein tas n=1 Tax=Acinetobacter apis TaxID=1229165 RepID=A0A217EET9_9GAMM|nr:NADP(H)-dependent aldo-keto reductase [Acinetobacter apis]SNQ28847.1 hypothetical protein SAMN05444584_0775 [Acinetobacter apis]